MKTWGYIHLGQVTDMGVVRGCSLDKEIESDLLLIVSRLVIQRLHSMASFLTYHINCKRKQSKLDWKPSTLCLLVGELVKSPSRDCIY